MTSVSETLRLVLQDFRRAGEPAMMLASDDDDVDDDGDDNESVCVSGGALSSV